MLSITVSSLYYSIITYVTGCKIDLTKGLVSIPSDKQTLLDRYSTSNFTQQNNNRFMGDALLLKDAFILANSLNFVAHSDSLDKILNTGTNLDLTAGDFRDSVILATISGKTKAVGTKQLTLSTLNTFYNLEKNLLDSTNSLNYLLTDLNTLNTHLCIDGEVVLNRDQLLTNLNSAKQDR